MTQITDPHQALQAISDFERQLGGTKDPNRLAELFARTAYVPSIGTNPGKLQIETDATHPAYDSQVKEVCAVAHQLLDVAKDFEGEPYVQNLREDLVLVENVMRTMPKTDTASSSDVPQIQTSEKTLSDAKKELLAKKADIFKGQSMDLFKGGALFTAGGLLMGLSQLLTLGTVAATVATAGFALAVVGGVLATIGIGYLAYRIGRKIQASLLLRQYEKATTPKAIASLYKYMTPEAQKTFGPMPGVRSLLK